MTKDPDPNLWQMDPDPRDPKTSEGPNPQHWLIFFYTTLGVNKYMKNFIAVAQKRVPSRFPADIQTYSICYALPH